jgi:hypothetical protein
MKNKIPELRHPFPDFDEHSIDVTAMFSIIVPRFEDSAAL